MFSFITMGKPSGQTTNTINILASAAFTLLIINPLMILQLGFQLSFLAVLSIVTFQPFIEKLWIPRNRIVAYFWSIISVSIAAQIGTAPIAMLTFHQFPIYFILSNIIAIPLSFTIMLSGVLFILFNWIALFSNPLALIFSGQIKALYWGLETLESLPFSLHSGIYLSTGFILLCYLTLILLYKLIVSRDAISLNLMLLALSTTSITFAIQKLNKSTENKIIFHATDASVISVIQGARTYLISSAPVDSMKGYAFDVLPFLESRNSNLLEEYPFQELTDNKANPCIEINNKHILILEDFDKELPVCNTEIVYLRSNYIDTLMALERYSGSLWILDNSIGYKSINFIEPFLCSHQIGYHTLKREGALELISSRVL
jgi:competence protein ComEC